MKFGRRHRDYLVAVFKTNMSALQAIRQGVVPSQRPQPCNAFMRTAMVGKYVAYALVVLLVLFALNWFDIVHIPFMDVPDLTAAKHDLMNQSDEVVRGLD
jgi:hypothetical protein